MTEKHQPYGIYEKYFKRPIDIVCASLAVLVFWWLYLIVAILVKLKLGSPVIFKQERPGRDGKTFMLYKFRTMLSLCDEKGNDLPDSARMTNFGNFLRKTSLDELPETFNILKGDMSVVGPRPLLVKYLPLYNEEQKHRHDVRPGLTGLAQVNGRNTISWQEKFAYDVAYVNKITFLGDCSIVIDTIKRAILKNDGINQEGNATMEEFTGNPEEKEVHV